MMDDLLLSSIKQMITKKFSPLVIYLFGSFSKGITHSDSDVDLAFLSDREYDDYEVFMQAQKLANEIGRDVDLIQLRNVSTVFQAQIVSTGKVIYCKDKTKRDWFEMIVFKKYIKLNEERQPILDHIRKRGTVYGK